MSKKVTKVPTMAPRYVAATGAPFSDEDASRYGPELLKIAEDNAVEDIRSLDKLLVYETVSEHPRKYPAIHAFAYNSDDAEAARKYRIHRCGVLVRSVRVETPKIGKRAPPQPMFLNDPDHVRRRIGQFAQRRRQVLAQDAMTNDPTWVSALGAQIRLVNSAVTRLEQLAAARACPPDIERLSDGLRAALNDYFDAVQKEAAE